MGETQERERVLAHFSQRYFQCNPGALSSEGEEARGRALLANGRCMCAWEHECVCRSEQMHKLAGMGAHTCVQTTQTWLHGCGTVHVGIPVVRA